MLNNLKPTLNSSIGSSRILWFESSNRYLIVDNRFYSILNLFWNSSTLDDFETDFLDQFRPTNNIIPENLGFELKSLIEELNTDSISLSISSNPVANPYYYTCETRYYTFKKYIFGISSNSPYLLESFHLQWQHLEYKSSDLASLSTSYYIIQESKNMYLYNDSSFIESYKINNLHVLQGQLSLQIINGIYGKSEDDWLACFHASTIANETESVMLVGSSGSGKSTLAAILMMGGYELLADDYSPMLRSDMNLYRYPNSISIKEGAFEIISDIVPKFSTYSSGSSYSKNTELKYLDPATNNFERDHYPCRKIILVKYSAETSNEFVKTEPEKVLDHFISDSWINPSAKSASELINWIKRVEFYRLTYHTKEFALKTMASLLETTDS